LCSFSHWKDEGILKIENNIFQNISDGTSSGTFKVASEKDSDDNELYTVDPAAEAEFAAYFETAGNMAADAGVDAVNPTASGDVRGAEFDGLDSWFEVVDYKGAFKPEENWAAGWTLSLGEVDAKDNIHIGIEEEEVQKQSSVKIFPNPVTEFATVEFDNEAGIAHSFAIYDMSGRTVKVVNNIYSSFQIERGNLMEGLYIYRMTNENGAVVAGGKLVFK
jgi:hypothetical protein